MQIANSHNSTKYKIWRRVYYLLGLHHETWLNRDSNEKLQAMVELLCLQELRRQIRASFRFLFVLPLQFSNLIFIWGKNHMRESYGGIIWTYSYEVPKNHIWLFNKLYIKLKVLKNLFKIIFDLRQSQASFRVGLSAKNNWTKNCRFALLSQSGPYQIQCKHHTICTENAAIKNYKCNSFIFLCILFFYSFYRFLSFILIANLLYIRYLNLFFCDSSL